MNPCYLQAAAAAASLASSQLQKSAAATSSLQQKVSELEEREVTLEAEIRWLRRDVREGGGGQG